MKSTEVLNPRRSAFNLIVEGMSAPTLRMVYYTVGIRIYVMHILCGITRAKYQTSFKGKKAVYMSDKPGELHRSLLVVQPSTLRTYDDLDSVARRRHEEKLNM